MQSKVKQLHHSISLNKDIKQEIQANPSVLGRDLKEDTDLWALMYSDKPKSKASGFLIVMTW